MSYVILIGAGAAAFFGIKYVLDNYPNSYWSKRKTARHMVTKEIDIKKINYVDEGEIPVRHYDVHTVNMPNSQDYQIYEFAYKGPCDTPYMLVRGTDVYPCTPQCMLKVDGILLPIEKFISKNF